jgi:hypothetical protein
MRERGFRPIFSELGEWIHGGKMGDDVRLDFEVYESAFNEQYKPSNWTGNPASDASLSTFGIDGTGGQVALWHRGAGDEPVVMLGSDGEVAVFARDLAGFLNQVAHGADPSLMLRGAPDDGAPVAGMVAWVAAHFPGRALASPAEEYAAAQALRPELAALLAGQGPGAAS